MAEILLTIDNPRKPNGELKADKRTFKMICEAFLAVLHDITPVDTGFCQSQWEMKVEKEYATFFCDCPYASFLDDGWSQQAPSGMTEPALKKLPEIAAMFL